jgi:hypothetical protein
MLYTRFESSVFLPVGHRRTLVQAAFVGTEEALHSLIMAACQPAHNCHRIFRQLQQSMMSHFKVSVEFYGWFSTYYKCTLSAVTHKLHIPGQMLIMCICSYGTELQWMFFQLHLSTYLDSWEQTGNARLRSWRCWTVSSGCLKHMLGLLKHIYSQ